MPPAIYQPLPVTIRVGREDVLIRRLAPEPSSRPRAPRHDTTFMNAFTRAVTNRDLPVALPADAVRTIARTTIDDAGKTVARIASGLHTAGTDVADVVKLDTAFSCLTVLPGEQPRGAAAGGRATQVPGPSVGRDPKADELGLRVMRFDDLGHLRDFCADAITRSLVSANRRGRAAEFAETGVRRPISVSLVLIQFADGTPQQWVPMASDGITRLSVCAAAVLGVTNWEPTAAALHVSTSMLPALLSHQANPDQLARIMSRRHLETAQEYWRNTDIDGPDEHATRIRQFLTLPADLYLVASDPVTGQPHPMESVMEGVVADCHTGVAAWATEDDARHICVRALKDLGSRGVLDPALVELFIRGDTTAAPARRGTLDRGPLRRAVGMFSTLLAAPVYTELKSSIRRFSGRHRLTRAQVVEYIAPLACQPWGTNKPIGRAWAYGGPVPPSLSDSDLCPRHPDDYLDLVEVATDQSFDCRVVDAARYELALAGGTALIADGVITTAVVGGSGGSASTLDYRGSVDQVIEALLLTEEGLTTLAVAANSFDPSCPVRAARLPVVDFDQPDRIMRDGAGKAVRITEVALAGIAAQADCARQAHHPDSPPSREPTRTETLQTLAQQLPADATHLHDTVRQIKSLHDETQAPCGLTDEEFDQTSESVSRILMMLGRLR